MSFNVVIDSDNAFNRFSIYDSDYAFDWSVFDADCKYEMTFSFTSSPVANQVGDIESVALTGLGTQARTFSAGQSVSAKTSNVIGLLNRQIYTDSAIRSVYIQTNTNPNINVIGTPRGNIFKVRLQKNGDALATTGITGGKYILILHFNKVEDGNKTN